MYCGVKLHILIYTSSESSGYGNNYSKNLYIRTMDFEGKAAVGSYLMI